MENQENKDMQDEIDRLRSSAASHIEEAPTIGKQGKVGVEIKIRRSPWVLRGLIIIIFLLSVSEAVLFTRIRNEVREIIISSAPPISAPAMPEISAPLPPPPIEIPEGGDIFEPEPTAVPLPSELEGIEYPAIEE